VEKRVVAAKAAAKPVAVELSSSRDKELVTCLVEARCLSRDQLIRLFWPGRNLAGVRKRLSELVRGDVLKRLAWYDRDGENLAYGLGPRGVREAELWLSVDLDAAREDITPAFLDHHVLLSELYVGLLAAPLEAQLAKDGAVPKRAGGAGPHARAAHPGFTWKVIGEMDMPWKQAVGGALEARLLRPDAVMVVPSQKRRIFIESETGSHTITTSNAQRLGATVNKIERYEAYCSTGPGKGVSWYAERYTDGYRPEVLFLVPTPLRRDNVMEAIAAWKLKHPRAACTFRSAVAVDEVKALAPVVWANLPPMKADPPKSAEAPKPLNGYVVSMDEAAAIRTFYESVAKDINQRKGRAKALGEPEPAWPAGSNRVNALLARFTAERPK